MDNICINCGKNGHDNRICNEPISSYGIINVKIPDINGEKQHLVDQFTNKNNKIYTVTSQKYPGIEFKVSNNNLVNQNDNYSIESSSLNFKIQEDDKMKLFCYYEHKIKFLMVSRKYSLGFVDFVRGRYELDGPKIKSLFQYMTYEEINIIFSAEYDSLLLYLLNRENESSNENSILADVYSGRFGDEYRESRKKFYQLKNCKFSSSFVDMFKGIGSPSIDDMYPDEIYMVKNFEFEKVLMTIFGISNNEAQELMTGKNGDEYKKGCSCFLELKRKTCYDMSNIECVVDKKTDQQMVYYGLNYYCKIRPIWKYPEWGFPKGRRDNSSEDNLFCACREFEEETGYTAESYVVLNKIEPIIEILFGTNNVNYRHVYYLALDKMTKDKINLTKFDRHEIGDLKWFSWEEAMERIRPYHVEKRMIITKIYLFIMNKLINGRS